MAVCQLACVWDIYEGFSKITLNPNLCFVGRMPAVILAFCTSVSILSSGGPISCFKFVG